MRYIDKYRMHAAARAINVRFLQDCYRNDINNPIPSPAHPKLSYDDFKNHHIEMVLVGGKTCCLKNRNQKVMQGVVIVCAGLTQVRER